MEGLEEGEGLGEVGFGGEVDRLEEEFFDGHGDGSVVVSSVSGELFWIFLVDVVEAFADFDRDSCGRADALNTFNAACEEDAENVLPALPVLRIFLGHGLKAVEQNFKEFCVGGVGMLLAELLEELGELLGFFKVGLRGVVVIVFDILIDLLEDLDFLGVGKVIFTVAHWDSRIQVKVVLGCVRRGQRERCRAWFR